jgi:predicted TIM-barrel fold metal-dependent hydrolase
MIIDVHAHCGSVAYQEMLVARGAVRRIGVEPYPPRPGEPPPPRDDSPADIEARLRIMDEAGVQMQVLSNPAGPYLPSADAAVEGAHLLNDSYAKLIREYPDRFAAYGVLPMPHVKESVREIGRCMDDLGFAGIVLACSIQRERSPVEDEFEPVYEELNRRGAVLYFHPSGNGICSDLVNDYKMTYAAGAPFEDTLIGVHLIAKRIPERYPNIKFVLSHYGGALPMLLNRLDHEAPPNLEPLAEPPSATAKRFYYDTVGHNSQIALQASYSAFGADHLMAGSDFAILLCFEPYGANFDCITQSGLPQGDIDKILSGNAEKLLGLKVQSKS